MLQSIRFHSKHCIIQASKICCVTLGPQLKAGLDNMGKEDVGKFVKVGSGCAVTWGGTKEDACCVEVSEPDEFQLWEARLL